MVRDLQRCRDMHAVELPEFGDEPGRVEEVDVGDGESRSPEAGVVADGQEPYFALRREGDEVVRLYAAAQAAPKSLLFGLPKPRGLVDDDSLRGLLEFEFVLVQCEFDEGCGVFVGEVR